MIINLNDWRMSQKTVICLNNVSCAEALVIPQNNSDCITNQNFICYTGDETMGPDLVRFSLRPGCCYPVYGILHYRDGLRYLVQNENGLPVLIPRQLFKIEGPRIPLDWQIAEYKFQEQSLLILSYDTITESYPVLCDLIELRPEAVRAFLDYKDSMMV